MEFFQKAHAKVHSLHDKFYHQLSHKIPVLLHEGHELPRDPHQNVCAIIHKKREQFLYKKRPQNNFFTKRTQSAKTISSQKGHSLVSAR